MRWRAAFFRLFYLFIFLANFSNRSPARTADDWDNAKRGVRGPVYGILCDGNAFEFFRFDGSTKLSSFDHGSHAFRTRLPLAELNGPATAPFIADLRPVCEIIFDLMLSGYASSSEVYHKRSEWNSDKEGKPRQSLIKWEQAITRAQEARKLLDMLKANVKYNTSTRQTQRFKKGWKPSSLGTGLQHLHTASDY